MKENKNKKIGFRFAFNGLVYALKYERNFKILLFCFFATLFFSFLLKISSFEWLIVLLISSAVLTTELINSTIEEIMDFLKSETDPHIKIIKDLAASSTLLLSIFAFTIGLIIFAPKLYSSLSSLLQ